MKTKTIEKKACNIKEDTVLIHNEERASANI